MSSAQSGASGLAIGATLSHYRIDALLGEGGMGVVYRARDERLKRDVALKVLSGEKVADDNARRRFRNEALALSKLNHPNVQTVYDFDTDAGVDFLVTEYVPGATLHDRIAGGPLPAQDVLELGAQMADGLAAAHIRGIVHRDLKPENIKVTPEGRLKILDFGIAQREALTTESIQSGTTDVIEPRTIIGTVPYMAPEQLRGEQTDARTDIFSAGCVLYEMQTGRRAFGETVMPRLIDSILNHTPSTDRKMPVALRRVIFKCLQKKPSDRYQSAAELGGDLRRAGGTSLISRRAVMVAAAVLTVVASVFLAIRFWAPSSSGIHSVAVLPLQNLSADPAQDYFADGMTDALITDLGRLGVDRVIARGSIVQYKGTKKSLAEIARELNVDALVSGAVMREGNRVRVTAELIDPKTQAQIWSDRYEADLRNILGLQSDIASTLASKIKLKLSRKTPPPRPVSGEAFDAYMKALSHKYKATARELDLRMQYLQLAVRKDPDFAAAHAEIAATWAARIVYQFSSPREAVGPAKAEALRALELDAESAEAHLALAVVNQYMEWDWKGAEKEYRRAIELNPGSPDIRFQYATLLGPSLGRFDEWKVQMDRCLELDPLSPFYRFFRGRHLMTLHKPEESIAVLRSVLQESPDFALIHDGLWFAYDATHRYGEALSEAEKSFDRKGDKEVTASLRGSGGDYQLAMRRAGEILEKRSAKTYVSNAVIARVYAYGGDREKAIAWLQHAYDNHDQGMVTLKNAPMWDSLHGDPRFQELVRRMKFPA